MLKTRLFSLLSMAAFSLGLSIPASAITLTVTPGLFSTQAGATTNSFDSGTLPSGYTATGNAGIVSGTVDNAHAAPTSDSTPYAYAGPGGSITINFGSTGVGYLGFYWGSPDDYNLLTFTDVNNVVTTYDLPAQYLNSQTAVYANLFDTGANWKSVTFTSTTAAFEFDNVATIAAVTASPEPTSIALLAGGLLALGAGALRRRKA